MTYIVIVGIIIWKYDIWRYDSMNALNYLMPSRARRELLKALWQEGCRGPVSELARLSGVAFSTAQRELMEMKDSGLAKLEYVGNATVYQANTKHPDGDLLRKLLSGKVLKKKTESGRDTRESQNILAHLKAMGAPLGGTETKRQRQSDESMLAKALVLAQENSTLARTLPIVLFKNLEKIDLAKLEVSAKKMGAGQILGFFLDLTGELADNPALRAKADSMRDRRFKKTRDFFKGNLGSYARRLADLNTPPIARKWHYRMNMKMDSFRSMFNKYVRMA